MIRWDRKGFAARTGFTDVKEGSALLAQVIDRHKKRFSAFPGWPVDLPLRLDAPLSWGGCSATACSSANSRMNGSKSCNAAPGLIFAAERRTLMGARQRRPRGKSEQGNNRTEGTT